MDEPIKPPFRHLIHLGVSPSTPFHLNVYFNLFHIKDVKLSGVLWSICVEWFRVSSRSCPTLVQHAVCLETKLTNFIISSSFPRFSCSPLSLSLHVVSVFLWYFYQIHCLIIFYLSCPPCYPPIHSSSVLSIRWDWHRQGSSLPLACF